MEASRHDQAIRIESNSDIRINPVRLPECNESPFADCIWLRIKVDVVNENIAKLKLTISIGTTVIAPRGLGGKVRLGINRAKLRFHIENGKIPYEGRWPEHEVETSIDVEWIEERRQRRGISSHFSQKASLGTMGLTSEATGEDSNNEERERATRRSFKTGDWVVRNGGSEANPYWEFRVLKTNSAVYLTLVDHQLGTVLTTNRNTLINYSIEFMDSDLRILESEGMFTGRAGTDDAVKWGIVLSIVRSMLAVDLRKAVALSARGA